MLSRCGQSSQDQLAYYGFGHIFEVLLHTPGQLQRPHQVSYLEDPQKVRRGDNIQYASRALRGHREDFDLCVVLDQRQRHRLAGVVQ